ncbi:glaA [Symbiodinium natans]|uniref:GlaA protein n=1 Tax=Symbiodinium natans TaxID=878477 RepID=A0A812NGU8_9DINO|nr:glaA [Symbiodinium natans]
MPVWVVFEVKCPTVNLEDIRIVGSLPELGSWETSRALPLATSERTYPAWRSAEISLPSHVTEVVQYKYIKVFDGSLVQWEDGAPPAFVKVHMASFLGELRR